MPHARTLTLGRGFAWWAEGLRLFRAAPGPWIAITVIWAALLVASSVVPFGTLVAGLLTPALAGGVMCGCQELADGGQLRVEHLFAGFSGGRLGPLVGLGVFSILAQVAVVVIAAALAFTLVPNLRVFAEALLTGAGTPLPAINPRTVLLIALIVAALYLPVMMALWFAPPLVALGAQTVMTSLGASLAACARNTLPFLAYGLLAMPLLLLALLPLGLGLLIFIPVTGASLFAGYRDVFATDS